MLATIRVPAVGQSLCSRFSWRISDDRGSDRSLWAAAAGWEDSCRIGTRLGTLSRRLARTTRCSDPSSVANLDDDTLFATSRSIIVSRAYIPCPCRTGRSTTAAGNAQKPPHPIVGLPCRCPRWEMLLIHHDPHGLFAHQVDCATAINVAGDHLAGSGSKIGN
jgi:hypothetical protein